MIWLYIMLEVGAMSAETQSIFDGRYTLFQLLYNNNNTKKAKR